MTVWSKFTAWFSGWPESKEKKEKIELSYLFEEEKELRKKANKPKGLNIKKKKVGDKND